MIVKQRRYLLTWIVIPNEVRNLSLNASKTPRIRSG